MQTTSGRRILRWYIRLQSLFLCLTLAALGVIVASERTQRLSSGTPAAVQRELPLPPRTITLPELPPAREWRTYLCLLPAGVGNVCGVVYAAEDFLRTYLYEAS